MDREQSRCVGAQTEKCRVPERDDAGVPGSTVRTASSTRFSGRRSFCFFFAEKPDRTETENGKHRPVGQDRTEGRDQIFSGRIDGPDQQCGAERAPYVTEAADRDDGKKDHKILEGVERVDL